MASPRGFMAASVPNEPVVPLGCRFVGVSHVDAACAASAAARTTNADRTRAPSAFRARSRVDDNAKLRMQLIELASSAGRAT